VACLFRILVYSFGNCEFYVQQQTPNCLQGVISKMTQAYYVSSGKMNTAHSLTHSLTHSSSAGKVLQSVVSVRLSVSALALKPAASAVVPKAAALPQGSLQILFVCLVGNRL